MQDRLAETERLKKECVAKTVAAVVIAPTRSVFDGICNVKVLTASDMDPSIRLGRSNVHRPVTAGHRIPPRPIELQCGNYGDNVFQLPTTIVEPPSPKPMAPLAKPENGDRSFSLDGSDEIEVAASSNAPIETRFLADSATITMPIGSASNPVPLVNPPKYKTMPSPTRANTILPAGAMCLNEIFEEGTDVGSSDTSTTTTPRPIAKHTNFTQVRSASAHQSSSNGGSSGSSHVHRRHKFHKSRTASCSSSDDDDTENRKKRAHKIVDSTKPFQTQRRDSNDDSSDSQDPSGNPAGGSATGSAAFSAMQMVGGGSNDSQSNGEQQSNDDDSTHTNDGNTNGRQQKSIHGFRRHRRRTGETRLRESQSLNRITEVQESELPILNTLQNPHRSPATLSTGYDNNPQSPTTSTHSSVLLGTSLPAASTHKSTATTPKLGFGARLLQGFKKSDSNSKNSGHEPKTKHNNNNNHKNWNSDGGGGNGNHISSAESNETLHWIKHSKPPLRVKAHQRLKNLKCLVDIFS